MNVFENINEKINALFAPQQDLIIQNREVYLKILANEEERIEKILKEKDSERSKIRQQLSAHNISMDEARKYMMEIEVIYKEKEQPFLNKRKELGSQIINPVIEVNNIKKEFDCRKDHDVVFNYICSEDFNYTKQTDSDNFQITLLYDSKVTNMIVAAEVIIRNYFDEYIEINLSILEKTKILDISFSGMGFSALSNEVSQKNFSEVLKNISIFELDKPEVEDMYYMIFDRNLNIKNNELYKTLKERLKEFNSIINNETTLKLKRNI